MIVSLKDGDISTIPEEEIEAYKKFIQDKYPDEVIDEIILSFDEEGYVNIETHKHAVPIIGIRRVSGYLSTVPKMNNAKQAEVVDRIKHGVTE